MVCFASQLLCQGGVLCMSVTRCFFWCQSCWSDETVELWELDGAVEQGLQWHADCTAKSQGQWSMCSPAVVAHGCCPSVQVHPQPSSLMGHCFGAWQEMFQLRSQHDIESSLTFEAVLTEGPLVTSGSPLKWGCEHSNVGFYLYCYCV